MGIDMLHGGDLSSAISVYGGRREKWLDLSTCVNQSPYPFMGISRSDCYRLPDSGDYEDCVTAARRAWGVGDSGHIVLGSGSQSIIQVLPYLFDPQDVSIVGYTYSEHSICWSRAGHRVYVSDRPETAESTSKIVIVVNPNNPDGRTWDDLYSLSRRLSMRGGVLIVDEAFCDLTPDLSLAGSVDDHLVVLRSLGKFYGLAGLRFGAAICGASLSERLASRLGPWSVSVPSLFLATKALSDTRWRTRAIQKLGYARSTFEALLGEYKLDTIGGTNLFTLIEHSRVPAIFDHLAERHILVRKFSDRPDWIRFGIPSKRGRLNRLRRALSSFDF